MSNLKWEDVPVASHPEATGKFKEIARAQLGGPLHVILGLATEVEHPETHEMVSPVMMSYIINSPLGPVTAKEGVLAVNISMDEAKQKVEENWEGIPEDKKQGLMNPNPIALMMMAIQQAGGGDPLGDGPVEDDDPSQYTEKSG